MTLLAAALIVAAQITTLGSRLAQGEFDIKFIGVGPILPALTWMWDEGIGASQNEWIGCLQAEVRGDTLLIVAMEHPLDIAVSTPERVETGCRKTPAFIGVVHPHYNGVCAQSEIDVWTYVTNPDAAVDLVLCGRDSLFIGLGKLLRSQPSGSAPLGSDPRSVTPPRSTPSTPAPLLPNSAPPRPSTLR